MRLDSEGGTAVCDERIDAYELWLVDHFFSAFLQQLAIGIFGRSEP
jgi:hypothetical protein